MVDLNVHYLLGVYLLGGQLVEKDVDRRSFPTTAKALLTWPATNDKIELPEWFIKLAGAETLSEAQRILSAAEELQSELEASHRAQGKSKQVGSTVYRPTSELAAIREIREQIPRERLGLTKGLASLLSIRIIDSSLEPLQPALINRQDRGSGRGDDPLAAQMWEICKALPHADRTPTNIWNKLLETVGRNGSCVVREDGTELVWKYDGLTERRITRRGIQTKLRRLLVRKGG